LLFFFFILINYFLNPENVYLSFNIECLINNLVSIHICMYAYIYLVNVLFYFFQKN